VNTSMIAGDEEQQTRMANDEDSDEVGGKGNGNGDEVGGQVTATMVKKRARVARAMVTSVVDDNEGNGDGGNMARNKNNGLTSLCSSPSCTRPPLALTTRAMTS